MLSGVEVCFAHTLAGRGGLGNRDWDTFQVLRGLLLVVAMHLYSMVILLR